MTIRIDLIGMLRDRATPEIIHVHVSHAAKDDDFAHQLVRQLRGSIRHRRLTLWSRLSPSPGAVIAAERESSFARAHIVVVLLSCDFLDDDRCVSEGERALARRADGVQILPVLVRPTVLDDSIFAGMALLPKSGPITTQLDEQALVDVAQDVLARIARLTGSSPDPTIVDSQPAGAAWRPSTATLADDTARIARSQLRNEGGRVTAKTIMDPYRRLVIRFCTLSHLDQHLILADLGLHDERDRDLEEPERFGRCFARARERGLLGALWDAVERAHPEKSTMTNPFART